MPGVGQRPRVGMFANASAMMGRVWNSEAGRQTRAGLEGFQDDATFGGGDQIRAGLGTLGDLISGRPPAYWDRIAKEHKSDQEQAEHYGTARTVGKLAGTLLLLGESPLKGGLAMAKRVPQVSRLLRRELAALGGTGAAGGAGGQAYSDIMTGHLSSFGDYAGAGVGGAIEGLMAPHGRPGRAGAIGGATTSLAQDLFNGRQLSLDKALSAASASGLAGKKFGVAGQQKFSSLTNRQKELAGETFSRLRTASRLEKTISTVKARLPLKNGKYTYPDQRTSAKISVESKAGIFARLSKRQKEAFQQLGNFYRVDHLLPHDFGYFTGFLGAQGSEKLQHVADRQNHAPKK